MSVLLVQSCSKSKNRPPQPCSALKLYDGYFFKIIKKARREDQFRDDIDICILSAEYGIIDESTTIKHYDRRMDAERAEDLRPDVVSTLADRVEKEGYDSLLVNVGGTYRTAIDGIAQAVTADVEYVEAEGIGEKGSLLKQTIRTDSPTPTMHA